MFIKNHFYSLQTGGSHALPKEMIDKIIDVWYHNKLIDSSHCVYEIGMGVPVFAFSLAGIFKKVVATDTDLEIYSNTISFLDSHDSTTSSDQVVTVTVTHENGSYEKPSFATEKSLRKIKEVTYSEVNNISDEKRSMASSATNTTSSNNEEQAYDNDSDVSEYTPSSKASTASTSSDDDDDED